MGNSNRKVFKTGNYQQPQQDLSPKTSKVQLPRVASRMSSSRTSATSFGSVGIGSGELTDTKLHYRPLPVGPITATCFLYDCIMFIIYCPEHDRILLMENKRTKISFLPFIVMPEGMTWDKASEMGIDAIIGRKMDTEMDQRQAEAIRPHYEMSYLHILRIQTSAERYYSRIAQYVKLEKSEGFECCKNTDHHSWYKASELIFDQLIDCWGPEVKLLPLMISEKSKLIDEIPLERAFTMLTESGHQDFLLSNNIKAEHVVEIYEDFLHHCYPSIYMCYRSFQSYMIKHGFNKQDKRLQYFFNACLPPQRTYIDFNDFLIGVVAMEPQCDSLLDDRIAFVFQYYDVGKRNSLNIDEFVVMLQDMNPEMSNDELKVLVQQKAVEIGLDSNRIQFENLRQAVKSGLIDLSSICKSRKSIISQISMLFRLRHGRNEAKGEMSESKVESKDKCPRCAKGEYRWATNAITIDTEGRCVRPVLLKFEEIKNENVEDEMVHMAFSQEYVFNNNSIPNILIDSIRQFHNSDDFAATAGIWCAKEEHRILRSYVHSLCQIIKGVMVNEKKLINLNAPAFVIGDIRGNLTSLIDFEKQFLHSFPIFGENIVFLGNYHGKMSHGFECLLFLYSLKVLLPNKVFLLRGFNEVIRKEPTNLQKQCHNKYGEKTGNYLYKLVSEVFDSLPLAAVIDETIICVHSGFPTNCKLNKLLSLPNSLRSIQKEYPFVFEILSRYPRPKKAECNSKSKAGDPQYHQHIFSRNSNCKSIQSLESISTASTSSTLFKSNVRPSQVGSSSSLDYSTSRMASIRSSSSWEAIQTQRPSLAIEIKSFQSLKSRPKSSEQCRPNSKGRKLLRNKKVTYDIKAFSVFLKSHGYRFMIRSGSVCSFGYKLNFRGKCLTVFSCAGHISREDQAAIISVNRSTQRIRFLVLSNDEQ